MKTNYPGWECNVCGHYNPAFEHSCLECKPNNFHIESPQYGRVTEEWKQQFEEWRKKQTENLN
jgi:hypothetical protein